MLNPPRSVALRLLREPLVHFFAIGALLFLAHHLVVGDPRTITVTPALKAELARRFQDLQGRKPSPAELEAELHKWEHDEALFREALRDRLDRDDPGVRSALVNKIAARAAFELPKREPTDAELDAWLTSHRSVYEAPLRYDYEFLAFPKTEPAAASELEQFERKLQAGADAATLGRPVLGGNLTADEMRDRIDPDIAQRIPDLPRGQWQRVEGSHTLWLARVKRVTGGLASRAELRPRLVVDWSAATEQEAIERSLQRTVARYRIEQRP